MSLSLNYNFRSIFRDFATAFFPLLFFTFNALCFMCVLWQYCKVLVAVDGCPMHKLADECTSVLCYNSKSIQKSIFVILMQIVCKFSLKTVILGFDCFFFTYFFYICFVLCNKKTENNSKERGRKQVLFL